MSDERNPNDRSEAALRERLVIAEKATKGPWSLQDKGAIPLVYGPNGERIAKAIDNREDTAHIAASSPDVVRADIEEILKMRAREDWLIEYICNKCSTRCPMPEGYRCKHKFNNVCYLNPSETEIRKQCWRDAARKAVEKKNG